MVDWHDISYICCLLLVNTIILFYLLWVSRDVSVVILIDTLDFYQILWVVSTHKILCQTCHVLWIKNVFSLSQQPFEIKKWKFNIVCKSYVCSLQQTHISYMCLLQWLTYIYWFFVQFEQKFLNWATRQVRMWILASKHIFIQKK